MYVCVWSLSKEDSFKLVCGQSSVSEFPCLFIETGLIQPQESTEEMGVLLSGFLWFGNFCFQIVSGAQCGPSKTRTPPAAHNEFWDNQESLCLTPLGLCWLSPHYSSHACHQGKYGKSNPSIYSWRNIQFIWGDINMYLCPPKLPWKGDRQGFYFFLSIKLIFKVSFLLACGWEIAVLLDSSFSPQKLFLSPNYKCFWNLHLCSVFVQGMSPGKQDRAVWVFPYSSSSTHLTLPWHGYNLTNGSLWPGKVAREAL